MIQLEPDKKEKIPTQTRVQIRIPYRVQVQILLHESNQTQPVYTSEPPWITMYLPLFLQEFHIVHNNASFGFLWRAKEK